MLPKENRLKLDKDIKAVVKGGRSIFDPVCGIKLRKNNLTVSRFAVVVGLKVSKSAVKRNKVKRHYREILRLNLEKLKPGFDVVLLASSKTLALDYSQKEEGFMKVLKKAGLI